MRIAKRIERGDVDARERLTRHGIEHAPLHHDAARESHFQVLDRCDHDRHDVAGTVRSFCDDKDVATARDAIKSKRAVGRGRRVELLIAEIGARRFFEQVKHHAAGRTTSCIDNAPGDAEAIGEREAEQIRRCRSRKRTALDLRRMAGAGSYQIRAGTASTAPKRRGDQCWS